MIIGIILICFGVILMALFGAWGNYYIQKGRSEFAGNNQKEIIENINSTKQELLKKSSGNLKEPTLSINSTTGITIKETTSGPYFWLSIQSLNAGSSNFQLDCFVLLEYENGSTELHKINLLSEDVELLSMGYRALVPYDENVTTVYLYMNGTYSNLSRSANYSINKLHRYRSKEGVTYGVDGTEKSRIVEIINSKNQK